MQVILLEKIKKLGDTGDVVKVKGGYGRNFLIPNKKALRATEDNVAYFESKKADFEKVNKEKLAAAQKVLKKIENAVVSLIQQAGEDGRLYGSVNAGDIAAKLSEQTGEQVERKQVVLHAPVKYIGVHDVEVDLHAEAIAIIHANVARTDDEAKDAAAKFAKGIRVMEGPGAEAEDKGDEKSEEIVEAKSEEDAEEAAPEAEEAKEKKPAKKKAKKDSDEEAAEKAE